MPTLVSLNDDLSRMLDEYCRETGQSREAVVAEALRRRLVHLQIDQFRRELIPYAEAQEILTDDDLLRGP